ncbi:MAG: hypothetical protein M3164_02455 [Actinomycetota bacterium]|nr:hypothetical protein [Actinomycetota bacterium]
MTKVLILVFVVLAACGRGGLDGDEPLPAKGKEQPSRVTIRTLEYAYRLPPDFRGGVVTIELDNTRGKEPHEAEIVRLDAGKTPADYMEALSRRETPTFATAAGGPGPVSPGKKATYTGTFAAGNYMLICHVPAPDGAEHAAKGMTAPLRILPGTAGTLPRADLVIRGKEMEFTGTEGLRAGSQTVRVSNEGQQDHHWALFKLSPGATADDFTRFATASFAPAAGPVAPGPPPFTDIPGLVATLPPGADATRTLELEPRSRYVFACFIPDTDGVPHFAKGMIKQVDLG